MQELNHGFIDGILYMVADYCILWIVNSYALSAVHGYLSGNDIRWLVRNTDTRARFHVEQ